MYTCPVTVHACGVAFMSSLRTLFRSGCEDLLRVWALKDLWVVWKLQLKAVAD